MRIKTLLIAISCTTLLFTSCEKEEMRQGGFAGGGNDIVNVHSRPLDKEGISLPDEKDTTVIRDNEISYNDSILHNSAKLPDIK
ncbi:hypothetical protein CLV62_101257 [Dysgonomonas alginatilytica]|uniref:Lipoprotein n=1 Tax=Dysgonomonas alginatilytica TaxID=1605892 RepID=A0A2V3PVY2_9BACT|nr:hypothetical protein [Dysgonomonas alginatilytica]PXV68991.1 hypothetical protein CLV62_101257 [Dysgonomonas alginatilytica]